MSDRRKLTFTEITEFTEFTEITGLMEYPRFRREEIRYL